MQYFYCYWTIAIRLSRQFYNSSNPTCHVGFSINESVNLRCSRVPFTIPSVLQRPAAIHRESRSMSTSLRLQLMNLRFMLPISMPWTADTHLSVNWWCRRVNELEPSTAELGRDPMVGYKSSTSPTAADSVIGVGADLVVPSKFILELQELFSILTSQCGCTLNENGVDWFAVLSQLRTIRHSVYWIVSPDPLVTSPVLHRLEYNTPYISKPPLAAAISD